MKSIIFNWQDFSRTMVIYVVATILFLAIRSTSLELGDKVDFAFFLVFPLSLILGRRPFSWFSLALIPITLGICTITVLFILGGLNHGGKGFWGWYVFSSLITAGFVVGVLHFCWPMRYPVCVFVATAGFKMIAFWIFQAHYMLTDTTVDDFNIFLLFNSLMILPLVTGMALESKDSLPEEALE
ncbi:hypothetical protein ACQKLP_09110 [Chitinophaga sp. NPDC101104]|uniref:hypothetical protein n=1 Tax=Chitinophaga sp. NPDC101104 TaxID=3390561 RepID=UPI003D0199A7